VNCALNQILFNGVVMFLAVAKCKKGFATHWSISVQCDLFNETDKLILWLLQYFHWFHCVWLQL